MLTVNPMSHESIFFKVKNTLMISYLIDLTLLLRNRSRTYNPTYDSSDEVRSSIPRCVERLQEMRIIFDRIRPVEKKMRYQIDKVLALSTSSFSVLNNDTNELDDNKDHSYIKDIDPLSYKPNPDNMMLDDDNTDEEDECEKMTTAVKKSENPVVRTLYKPPRLSAVTFHEQEKAEQKEARLKKQAMDKMKQSELLQSIKAQFSDKPEEDDLRGGANVGKQREVARRFAERVAEKARYEEENMIRLSTSRKEKKMREKIMREEFSNLRVISDVGDLASGVSTAFQTDKKTKRSFTDDDGFHEPKQKTQRHSSRPKNKFQEALYDTKMAPKKVRNRR